MKANSVLDASPAPLATTCFSASGSTSLIFFRNSSLRARSGELERRSSPICRSRSVRNARKARTRSLFRCAGSVTTRAIIMSTRSTGSSVASRASLRARSGLPGYLSSAARKNTNAAALSPDSCSTNTCAYIACNEPSDDFTHAAASSRARGKSLERMAASNPAISGAASVRPPSARLRTSCAIRAYCSCSGSALARAS